MPGQTTRSIGVLEYWSVDLETTNKFGFLMSISRLFCKTKAEFSVSITPALQYSNRMLNYRQCYAAPFQGAKAKPGPEGLDSLLRLEVVSKCSILFKIKEGENFNHRNTLSISRIKI